MLSFLLYIFLLCLSLVSWVLLTLVGYALLRYCRRSPALLLSGTIVAALWVVTTFNVWYEGLILVEGLSLVSSTNSWAFVLITPLFYLYYRLLLTGSVPCRRQWVAHLSVPGVLLLVYVGAALWSSVPDKLVYNWREFGMGWPHWWGVFRISCYVLLAGQLAVYLPRLFATARAVGKQQQRQAMSIRREMLYVTAFCGVALAGMLIPYTLFRLLYTLAVALLACYLFSCAPIYRWAKRRLGFYLIPNYVRPKAPVVEPEPEPEHKPEEGPAIYLSAEKEVQLEKLLRLHLYDPQLTPGLLARELCTNQTYLSCYFRHQRGTTFTKYLCDLRMEEAERLLLETDLQIIDIAERVGFQTLSGFYAAFGSRHSLPPAQWRKR